MTYWDTSLIQSQIVEYLCKTKAKSKDTKNVSWICSELVLKIIYSFLNIGSQWVKSNYISTSRDYGITSESRSTCRFVYI